jgi:hypothetical protein
MDELSATVADRRHSVNHLNQPRLAGEGGRATSDQGSASFVSPPTARLKWLKRRGCVNWNRDFQARGEVDVCAM